MGDPSMCLSIAAYGAQVVELVGKGQSLDQIAQASLQASSGTWPEYVYRYVEQFIAERDISSPESGAARVAIRCRLQQWWSVL